MPKSSLPRPARARGADQASPDATRVVVHECGCEVEYATDRFGREYPLVVVGCEINEWLVECAVAGPLSAADYLFAAKGHRGREVR